MDTHRILVVVAALVLQLTGALSSGIANKIRRAPRARKNEQPFSVWIEYNGTKVCSGSLVHEKLVLTLSSCIRERDISLLKVIAGDRKLDKPDGETVHGVSECYEYTDNSNSTADTVLLRLNSTVDTALPNIDTITVSDMVPSSGDACLVSAYGDTNNGKDYKQKLDIAFLESVACEGYVSGISTCFEPLKRKHKGRKRMCEGDQGSPIACDVNGTMVQVGINLASSCVSKEYAARAASDLIDWIASVIISLEKNNEKKYDFSYFVGFMSSMSPPYETNHIYVCAQQPTYVKFSHPAVLSYLGVESELLVDGDCLDIPLQKMVIEPTTTGVFQGYGVRVSSMQPLSVYADSMHKGVHGSSDATSIYSENKLSTLYTFGLNNVDFLRDSPGRAEFAVVGTLSNTQVTIRTANGTEWTVNLNENDIYQHIFENYASTKIITVEASAKVAVFVGQQSALIYFWITGTPDHLYTQVRPIDNYYQEYIMTAAYPTDMWNIIEVSSVHNGEHIIDYGGFTNFMIPAGEVSLKTAPGFEGLVQSNDSFNLVGYNANHVKPFTDPVDNITYYQYPSSWTVPALAEYQSSYMFYARDDVHLNMVTLIIKGTNVSNIRLDGNEVTPVPYYAWTGSDWLTYDKRTVYGTLDYVVFYINVPGGTHKLYSTDDAVFGAVMSNSFLYSQSTFSLV